MSGSVDRMSPSTAMPIRRTGALAMRTSSLTLPSGTRGARQTINQATQAPGPTDWAKDADPQKIIEILSFRFRAPTLANGDGEPLVRCSVEFELPQADTTPTLSQGIWATTTGRRMSAMALALSGLGSWPP